MPLACHSSRRTLLAAVTICALAVAGCSKEQLYGEPYAADREHAFVINSSQEAYAVRVDGETIGLDSKTGHDLDAFVADFLHHGSGTIDIAVGRDPAKDIGLRAELDTLQAALRRRGVRGNEIRVTRTPAQPAGDDTIVLSYLRYQARRLDCGQQPTGSGFNPRNATHPDYGCSVQANIAASVANPADLERPRRRQPADAMRRSLVIESYRSGEATGRERGEGEQARSIEQLIQ